MLAAREPDACATRCGVAAKLTASHKKVPPARPPPVEEWSTKRINALLDAGRAYIRQDLSRFAITPLSRSAERGPKRRISPEDCSIVRQQGVCGFCCITLACARRRSGPSGPMEAIRRQFASNLGSGEWHESCARVTLDVSSLMRRTGSGRGGYARRAEDETRRVHE